jgi:hypothetical protein
MSFKLALTGLSVAALLLGCAARAPAPTGGPAPGPSTGGVCNAQGAQYVIGKVPGASVVEEARQRSGAYMARVLRPGQPVTLEYSAQRLNLELDASGTIARARCG